jgi:uncharacterized membrane protein YeaQ/YmgE (transglycosylase-associated protein family)
MSEIIAWLVLGLIAGAIAKAIMPGKDPGGIIVTILIGIVSIALAVLGSVLLLWIYRMATRGRTTTP